MQTTLGDALRAIRMAPTRGLSQSEAALLAGIARTMLSGYERNRVRPSLETVLAVLDAYGATDEERSIVRDAYTAVLARVAPHDDLTEAAS